MILNFQGNLLKHANKNFNALPLSVFEIYKIFVFENTENPKVYGHHILREYTILPLCRYIHKIFEHKNLY